MYEMTIADRIRNKRNELNLSQSDLAVRANYCDKTRISKIENSGNDISMKQVKRIAAALGVSTAYLMGWEEQARVFVQEVSEQTKSISNFLKTHTVDYNRLFDELLKQYEKEDVERAFKFTTAFLRATPERQKIALEILQQSHPEDS